MLEAFNDDYDDDDDNGDTPSLTVIYELIKNNALISVKYPKQIYSDGTFRMEIMPGRWVEDLIQFYLDGCGELSDDLKTYIKSFQTDLA